MAPDYSELLQRIREAAGDPTGKLMQDELVERIAAWHSRAAPDAVDAARLDWLQEHRETVYRCTHQEWRATTDSFRHHEKIQVFDGWAVLEDQDPKPTIREAIDFAIDRSRTKGEAP